MLKRMAMLGRSNKEIVAIGKQQYVNRHAYEKYRLTRSYEGGRHDTESEEKLTSNFSVKLIVRKIDGSW